jgi:vancomycin resistance protein YoaR
MGDNPPSRPRFDIWVFFLLALGVLALAAVATLTVHELRYGDRIYEGVRVAGIPLGGLTIDEAADTIRDGLTPFPGQTIMLRYGDRTWSLSPSDLGVSVDAQALATEAFAVGRQGALAGTGTSVPSLVQGLREDLTAQWHALDAGVSFPPLSRFDRNRLTLILKQIAREVDLPPREGTLSISGLEVSGAPGEPGRMVDQTKTRAAIASLLQAGTGGTVDLVVEDRLPAVMSVDAAVAEARSLIGKSLVLVADGKDGTQRFAIDPATLRSWLSLIPVPGQDGAVGLSASLDEAKVRAFVEQAAKQLNRPAFDAALDFDRTTGQVVVLQPSQTGQSLDVEASVAAIKAAILPDPAKQRASGVAASLGATQVITAPLTIVQPKVDSNKISELGIVEQVSEGTTYFKGSTRERIQNIVNAAGKFTGAVIPPGEEFSFNTIVGDVSTANGFVDSLIIRGDRTETGVGGGVCQVSTTAYRAAFWGGFPIIERYPHSYVVSWYGEPGYDASIFTPSADFRFLNDTGHFLLVKPEVDTQKGRITFYFYGTKPDRVVEAEKSVITNKQPAPQPLYQADATLPAGTIKQVDWAKDGMDVLVKRIIRYGDGRVKENKIVSKYRPWQAVYLYGPGAKLPPGAATQ